jgi:antibiotic biosynthesis monooxygenase (ABM) superfamily enzyme
MALNEELVTLVIKHRIRKGFETSYAQWLKRTVEIAALSEGHLGANVQDSHEGGLRQFTCVLRFASPAHLQAWLASPVRRELIQEVLPMLADGDVTEVRQDPQFWFAAASEESVPPPLWKQAALSMLVILPLSMAVPLLWMPVLRLHPWLSSYLGSNIVITLTIVLLVVYVFMPAATRTFASWLTATQPAAKSESSHGDA